MCQRFTHARRQSRSSLILLTAVSLLGSCFAAGCADTSEPAAPAPTVGQPAEVEPGDGTSDESTWLDEWIARLNGGTADDPPERITRYAEADGDVYLVEYGCCDRFVDLLDADGNLLGHPSGGLSGDGDGRTMFTPKATGAVVWP